MPSKPFTPPDWQEATLKTIGRLRAVFELNPDLTADAQRDLYKLAYEMTARMEPPGGTTAFWGAWVNVLRILVAGQSDTDLTKIFS